MRKWEPSPQFDALVLEHLPLLKAVVRGVLGRQAAGDVDDVCQETVLKCRRSFRPELAGSFRFWFTRAGRNNAINVLRRVERMRPVEEIFDDAETVNARRDPDPVERIGLRETRRRIEEAVEAVIPNRTHRTIFRLRHFEELSYKDIARECGVPVGTVMSALNRAKTLLREHLASRRSEFKTFLAA